MLHLKRYCPAIFWVFISTFGAAASYAASPQIATGDKHAVVLKSDGTVWSWGDNQRGQIGAPVTTSSSFEPVGVAGLSGIIAVAAGGRNSAVLKNDGTVWMWGDNASGQLGNGTTTMSAAPVQITNFSGVTAIVVNEGNALALKSDGTVWAWGDNIDGQLGNGTTLNSLTPVQVAGLTGVAAVAMAPSTSFALKSDGTVWAWGSNYYCRLGSGTAPTSTLDGFTSTPMQVIGLDRITSISTGDSHTLALKADGTVWGWGNLSYSSITNPIPPGPPYCTPTPAQLPGLSGIAAVNAGLSHALALKGDGTILAWGENAYGEVGNGTADRSDTPVQVSNMSGVTSISSGLFSSYALKSDGTVWAWGHNGFGQLGNSANAGTAKKNPIPLQALINLGASNMVSNPYQGLWWNPDESGWGLSVAQHGSMIFAAWYTHDQAGLPIWYVMSSCPVSGTACGGDIYQVTGGTPPTAPWNGSGNSLTKVGTGALSFTDADSGTLAFSLNGVAGTKTISRQVFATGAASPAIDYSDLWWNASESGWGVALTQQYGMIFAVWYAYDAAGKPVWYVASSCVVSGNGCAGDLYQVTGGSSPIVPWNGASKVTTKVGTVSFTFADAGSGTMSYTINGASGSREISRQAF